MDLKTAPTIQMNLRVVFCDQVENERVLFL